MHPIRWLILVFLVLTPSGCPTEDDDDVAADDDAGDDDVVGDDDSGDDDISPLTPDQPEFWDQGYELLTEEVVIAPPPGVTELDPTVATDFEGATEFLYDGPNPVQVGVVPGTMDGRRVAVIRGRVVRTNGAPLPDAVVSVLGHEEYGYTLSRADGGYDLAVNGGGLITVRYEADDHLPALRQVQAPWRDYVWAPEVALKQLDAAATSLQLDGSAGVQVAEGSLVIDDDGERQATLVFPAGITAEMVLAGGGVVPVTTATFRATEYTDEDHGGPEAMPAPLPPTSAYTYAVELSLDEALDAGAVEVTFDDEVAVLTDNFLGFPAGTAVPCGYLDTERGVWVPSESGLVVDVLGETGGLADLDVDGSALAADPATLTALGITEDELSEIAARFGAGDSIWRVPVQHFSPADFNWGFGAPFGAQGVELADFILGEAGLIDHPCHSSGSIIECQNQLVGEAVGLAGTSLALTYWSNQVPGWSAGRAVTLIVSGDEIPAELLRIDLEIEVAGRKFADSVPAATDQTYDFVWDGQDAYGRYPQGAQVLTVRIGYVYEGVYDETAVFGDYSLDGEISVDPMRDEVTFWTTFEGTIGGWDATALQMGGWRISDHHVYDPVAQTVYYGNGWRHGATSITEHVIGLIAGTGTGGFGGDGGPGTDAQLQSPSGLAAGPDGSVYIADTYNNRIRRVDPFGTITTIAGNGMGGFDQDGIPAVDARLNAPQGVDVGADGSVYIADTGNHRIRRVRPDGIIETVAGSAALGYAGDGGFAELASLHQPTDVLVAPDGSLYISDRYNVRVRRVRTNGVIQTVAGIGVSGYSGDGGPGVFAELYSPTDLAYGPGGELYICDEGNNRIRRLSPDGIIDTVAGSGDWTGDLGDGGPALDAALYSPHGIAVDKDGSLYIADLYNRLVRRVAPDGVIHTIVGTGDYGDDGDEGPAAAAELGDPMGLAIGPGGDLYVLDQTHHSVRRVGTLSEWTSFGNINVVSEDGAAVFVFDEDGRHLRTLDTLTGVLVREFTYDDGLLTEIADHYGNVIQLHRDGDGVLTEIVAPGGQTTTVTMGWDDYVERIENTANEAVELVYYPGGLISSVTWPEQNGSLYGYDALGRLDWATQDGINEQFLSRVDFDAGFDVTRTTSLGRTTEYGLVVGSAGDITSTVIGPTGATNEVVFHEDGSAEVQRADGTTVAIQVGPDPRWGLLAPTYPTATFTTPSGRTRDIETTRQIGLTDPDDPLSLEWLEDTTTVDGRTATEHYDTATRTMLATSPEGRELTTILDTHGRVAQVDPGLSYQPITLTYDAQGRLDEVAHGDTLLDLEYDPLNRLTSTEDALQHLVQYHYDDADRVERLVLPSSREITFDHDDNGNVTGITPPGTGAPLHILGYDHLDAMESYTPPGSATSYLFEYDQDRLLTLVTLPSNREIDLVYETGGDRLTGLSTDEAGQIQARDETIGGVLHSYDYTYDDDGQLTEVYRDGPLVEHYAYDDRGNRPLTHDGSATFDDQDRLVTLDGTTYQCDEDGFLVQRGADTFLYSSLGELLEAQVAGETVTYAYDGVGRRISRTDTGGTTHYYYGNQGVPFQLTASIDPAGELSVYYYDPNGALFALKRGTPWIAAEWYYVASDQIGTPKLVIDDTGAVVKQRELDHFGRVLSDSNPAFDLPVGFAGGIDDPATGWVRFGYRDYDPQAGRWTAKDPILFAGGDPNLYRYVLNSPTVYRDPSGLFLFDLLASTWDLYRILTDACNMSAHIQALYIDLALAAIPGVAGAGALSYFAKTNRYYTAVQVQKHHIFPRQFQSDFMRRGIMIDDYTVALGSHRHLSGVHGRGSALSPGRWNQQWAKFFANNPNATTAEVFQQGGVMMDQYGLSGLPIIPY